MEEIALHVKRCTENGTYKPRTVSMPYYDGPIPELTEGEPKEFAIRRPRGWGSSDLTKSSAAVFQGCNNPTGEDLKEVMVANPPRAMVQEG